MTKIYDFIYRNLLEIKIKVEVEIEFKVGFEIQVELETQVEVEVRCPQSFLHSVRAELVFDIWKH